MSPRTIPMDDALHEYLLRVGIREPTVLAQLREATAALPGGEMQISPEQGQFMGFLVELIAARRILEIGTFTGYSTLCMALSMPRDGHIDTCDVDAETTEVARRYWQNVGVSDRISLHLGPAVETLRSFVADRGIAAYDVVFVDADKENYDAYFELSLRLLRPGGLIMFDNVLWGGSVIDPTKTSEATHAIRALNAKLHGDSRISLSMVPIGDGLTLARKR